MSALKTKYDFVIVGGGTAGLVLAARLTENESVSVLILESGESATEDPRVTMPAGWSSIIGTEYDWDFITSPQENLNNRRVGQPQGRVVGGSSAINGQVFVPPRASDFDAWESFGNHGWAWCDVAPYFRKFHTLSVPDQPVREHLSLEWLNESTRGVDGPIQAVFTSSVQDPLSRAWNETFKALGFELQGDPFSGRAIGAWNIPRSIDAASGTRSYAASAYLDRLKSRANLQVTTGANVSRILLNTSSEGDAAIASGVAFELTDGTTHRVYASKEVIIAAGVFGSPKLLELSGIGDKSLLEKLDIEVKIDNPNVGGNLQDHMMTGLSFEAADGVMTGDCLLRQEPEFMQLFKQMYEEHKSGPLASQSLTSYAYMPVPSEKLEMLEPGLQSKFKRLVTQLSNENMTDLEKKNFDQIKSNTSLSSSSDLLQQVPTASWFMLPAQVNLHNGPKQAGMMRDPRPGNFVSLGVSLQQPLSRGTSHISSTDPSVPPIIDPRYLSHPLDIELYARHLMGLEVLATTAPLSNFLKTGGRRAQPGEPRVDTLESAKAYLQQTILSSNHPVGTCAMLPRDMGGVVDERLRVYGAKGLRVVDSSIMPLSPCANIQTTVYTVAEKAADLIKEDHGLFNN
ncbi:putative GMC oxidoreductase [Xylariaceae sp. FL0255]|nr:putative GMC oxidoreductase [Xylariaceae sp. FL0255]